MCEHRVFKANVDVNKLLDTGRFFADVTVECAECGQAFEFIGPASGVSIHEPRVSQGRLELRCPITPRGVRPPPMPAGTVLGFDVRGDVPRL